NLLRLTRENNVHMGGGGAYPNLFDAHPPFQIDGNFGGTAGIGEMLMQSQDSVIRLLPAIPGDWRQGSFKGLVARGGFVVDADWSDGEVKIKIRSLNGGVCRLRVGGRELRIDTKKEQVYSLGPYRY